MKYNYNNNKKNEEREQLIYIETTTDCEKQMKKDSFKQFFFDATCNASPDLIKDYKLLTISTVDKKICVNYIIFLIYIKYEDAECFSRILDYLAKNSSFKSVFINIDFSLAERSGIIHSLLINQPVILSCFFHYSNNIMNRLKDAKIIKTKKLTEKISNYEERWNYYAFCLIKKF